MKQKKQLGMTLLELTVVLLILVALAGLAIPYVSGTNRKALCNATDITMANIKRAIMDGYYLDTLGKFPQDLDGLTVNGTPSYNLHFLFADTNLAVSRTHKAFDPSSAIGWRSGGYLQNGFVLESNLTGTFANSTYTDPFLANHIVVMDGWGRPIALQVTLGVARLVSAGFGSGVGVGKADFETTISGNRAGDDRVLYLNAPTPSADINLDCE